MSLSLHQQRVVIERDELDGKVFRLSTFLDSPTRPPVDPAEVSRMAAQLYYMRGYLSMLDARIVAFTAPVLTAGDAAADRAGTPRPDHPSTVTTE